ncbi:LuxR C-terminal-related transcriptional regulator [Micromonospora sp. NBC_01699]|uniref:helix-turn-helix transcriptional regulator n=1 Tax=Micromonospora sp. NBC_01699 TaxID=2975984 RepID=UPI002E2BDA5D|nr:LuxR C-terminal-related transcriptional regulator [Micromonospora sp. NBC_01699]
MSPHTAIRSELVLDGPTRALLDAVDADPHAPLTVAVTAPGGYGKSALLHELAGIYRRAGHPVLDGWPVGATAPEPGAVLLVDDAHLLDGARLRELRHRLDTGPVRLVVAYRPWPRPAALVELAEQLSRDRPPLLLAPFTAQRTAARLANTYGHRPEPALVSFVQGQTGGVPRFVERLAAALRPESGGPTQPPTQPPARPAEAGAEAGGTGHRVPPAALLPFGTEVADLTWPVRRLLLAVAAGVPLPVDLLGALLEQDPDGVDETLAEARASGLLGPDDRLPPIVERAVTSLSPASQRTAVWQRLAELQRGRGAPVLPLVRSMLTPGVGGEYAGPTIEAAAEEALADQPSLAADLFAAAAAAGRPTTARQAYAAALAGDLDTALRLADRLVCAADADDRRDGATVAATALAHRGQLGRGAELYRWSNAPSSAAFAAIATIGTGHVAEPDAPAPQPSTDAPPTLLTSAALLTVRGVRETLTAPPTAALSTLVQAAALLEPAGRTVLLPDSPAALAALVALHCGELEIGERVLDRAIAAGLGGALMSRRHRLLQAWILMVRGRTALAADALHEVTGPAEPPPAGPGPLPGPPRPGRDNAGPLESRDQLFASALEMGIARRNSDLPAVQRAWGQAREALVRHPVDLFSFLPLGEITIAAARLGELNRLEPYLREAYGLLDRLGAPALWATPLRWSGLHAAIIAELPAAADEHVAALGANVAHSRYSAVMAAAAESWVEVLRGTVDPGRVESAARGLHDAGLGWDGARLAGQAAIRTADRRAMTALLDCARMLQGRPAGQKGGTHPGGTANTPVTDAVTAPTESRLSDREQEVADLVLTGLTYKQIGDRLFISAKTVEHHVARMRQRLNCANRGELLNRLRELAAARVGNGSATPTWPKRPAS